MEVLKYVKYCLTLFDECTVNDLGHFYFYEAPLEKDNNNNVIGSKQYIIGFSADYARKARLTGILAGKEGCDSKKAETVIQEFASQILFNISREGEVWLNGIGLLRKNTDGSFSLRSHKFPIKTFAETIAPQKNKWEKSPIEIAIPKTASYESKTSGNVLTAILPQARAAKDNEGSVVNIAARENHQEKVREPDMQPVYMMTSIEQDANYAGTIAVAPLEKIKSYLTAPLLFLQKNFKNIFTFRNNIKLAILGCIIFLHFYIKNEVIPSFKNAPDGSAQNKQTSKPAAGNEPKVFGNDFTAQNGTNEKQIITASNNNTIAVPLPSLLKQKDKTTAEKEQQKTSKEKNQLPTVNTSNGTLPSYTNDQNSSISLPVQNVVNKINADEPDKKPAAPVVPSAGDLKLPVASKNTLSANNTTSLYANSEFPGGTEKLIKFIKKNVQYPIAAKEENISGSVKVSFTIDENGSIKNPVIVQGLGSGFDEEAIRVISKMPKWKPANSDGMNVSSQKTIKIVFQLAKE